MKSRARVSFEQQILAFLLVFHQTRNLSWIHTKQINQSARCISFNPQQLFLLRDKLIMRGEKRETLTQNVQRNNVARQAEDFISRISPP